MSFNPNIPTTADPILQSYFQLRANFQAINNSFAVDHIALNTDPNDAGDHKAFSLQPVTDPTTDASHVALYNKLVTGVPELFFRPNSNQTPIQLTYPSIKVDGTTTQYSFLAGPFIVYGGIITGVNAAGVVVNLSPGTTLIFVDLLATNSTAAFPNIPSPAATAISGTSFTARTTNFSGQTDAYYFAIGI